MNDCSPSGVVRRKIRSIGRVEAGPDPQPDLVADPQPIRCAAADRDDVPDRAVVVERGELDPVGQPLTAPAVRPPTMYFCIE